MHGIGNTPLIKLSRLEGIGLSFVPSYLRQDMIDEIIFRPSCLGFAC